MDCCLTMACEECKTTEGLMVERDKSVLCERCGKIYDYGKQYITRLTEAKLIERGDGGAVIFLTYKRDEVAYWFNIQRSKNVDKGDERDVALTMLFQLWEDIWNKQGHAKQPQEI